MKAIYATTLFFLLTLLPAAAHAQEPVDITVKANIIEQLGRRVSGDLLFVDAQGQKKPLREFMLAGKPAILTPVYFECPRLCNLTLNGVAKLIRELELKLGEDYRVLTVSFDPDEGPQLARAKAANYYATVEGSGQPETNWPFLTGDPGGVGRLMEEIGFNYTKDQDQWIHTAGIVLLTPDGIISHYVYGIDFSAKDVRYALIEASKGAIGTTIDRVFLYCFHFDPQTGKYTPIIWRITQIGCTGVLLLLIALIVRLRLKEKRRL